MDDFTPIKKGERSRFRAKNTLVISHYSSSSKLTINLLAYEAFGKPETVTIAINLSKKQIKVTPDGPFLVNMKKRTATSIDLKLMPEGSYVPIGNNVYEWRGEDGVE